MPPNLLQMKPYTLTTNRLNKTVHANSYLEALMEESAALKKNGQTKFLLEVSNKNGKLASYVRS